MHNAGVGVADELWLVRHFSDNSSLVHGQKFQLHRRQLRAAIDNQLTDVFKI